MGCLKNFFAMVGCATVLLIGGAVAWHYRSEISTWAARLAELEGSLSDGSGSLPATVGRPSTAARREARRKAAEMELAGGPPTITLAADEVATLVEESFSDEGRETVDSLAVILGLDEIVVRGIVTTDIFAREVLGRLGGALNRSEAFSMTGDLAIVAEGEAELRPTSFRIGVLPVPRPLILTLVNSLSGGSGGAFSFGVPTTVDDARVRPEGVTFYRRTDR